VSEPQIVLRYLLPNTKYQIAITAQNRHTRSRPVTAKPIFTSKCHSSGPFALLLLFVKSWQKWLTSSKMSLLRLSSCYLARNQLSFFSLESQIRRDNIHIEHVWFVLQRFSLNFHHGVYFLHTSIVHNKSYKRTCLSY